MTCVYITFNNHSHGMVKFFFAGPTSGEESRRGFHKTKNKALFQLASSVCRWVGQTKSQIKFSDAVLIFE
jgi:hypothetical protein